MVGRDDRVGWMVVGLAYPWVDGAVWDGAQVGKKVRQLDARDGVACDHVGRKVDRQDIVPGQEDLMVQASARWPLGHRVRT